MYTLCTWLFLIQGTERGSGMNGGVSLPSEEPAHLESFIMPLKLAAQTFQLTPGQDGFAVLTLQLVLLLDDLGLSLLQVL